MSGIRTTEALEAMLGQNGFVYIADVALISGEFIAIQVLEPATITTTGDVLSLVNVGEGQVIFGRFKSVLLAGGRVIAYKG